MPKPGFDDAAQALELAKVLEGIASHTHSNVSAGAVRALMPMGSADEVRARFRLVEELRALMQAGESFGLPRFEDIRPVLDALRPPDSVLDPQELLLLRPALDAMTITAERLSARRIGIPYLASSFAGLGGFAKLVRTIDRAIGPEGDILDSASFELSELRAKMRALDRRISRRLEDLTRDTALTPFLQDTFITKRSGRWVVPVRMDSKGMVSGVVHDVSRSGETAFIEPLEIIGLSNELENASAETRAEELRILRSICSGVRAEAAEIEAQFDLLVRFDTLQAISAFSERFGLSAPEINDTRSLSIIQARHPILMMRAISEDREREPHVPRVIIPLDMELGGPDLEQARAMVITGPNAGGKTIAIKTVGLMILMGLSGIPLPASSSTSLPFVKALLADIGDEQSVEAHLSTFSAHISNIARIISEASEDSIVLMDELGTGTDPSQGAALGSAILHDLMERGALVCATTHLIDIVVYVNKTPGMLNASMEFDRPTLKPLYRLKRGEPGQSYAIEVARQYGLPERILARARELAGTLQAEFERLVGDLKEQRMGFERAEAEVLKEREALRHKRADLERILSEAEAEKKSALRKAYEDARDVLATARREAGALLEQVKRDKSRTALKSLEKASAEAAKKAEELAEKPEPLPIEEIKPGMEVYVSTVGREGVVEAIDLRQSRVRVNSGGKELEVPASGILPSRRKQASVKREAVVSTARHDEAASAEIKLIGMRVDEALEKLEPFLDHAVLDGLGSVRVIHGIGTGALRKAVREHLHGHPHVASFRPGGQGEGGDGATVVELR